MRVIQVHFKFSCIVLLLLVISLFSSLNIAARVNGLTLKTPNLLTVCSYSQFKPISYGEGQGYEADLLRAVAQLWKIKIKFYPEPIYEGIWKLPSRQHPVCDCDIAAGGITPAEYRIKEGAVFSRVTTSFNQSLLVKKEDYESGRVVSYQSFKNTNMKIGVVPGTTGERYAYVIAKENGVPFSVFVRYASESELLPALRRGEIRAIARGEIGNEYQVLLDPSLITIAKRNFREGFTFAINSKNKKLFENLNRAIGEITNNGKIGYREWLKNHRVFVERVRSFNLKS